MEADMIFSRFTRLFVFAATLAGGVHGAFATSPLSYGTYYDETSINFCGSSAQCNVYFSQTPSNDLVLVRKLRCMMTSSLTVGSAYLYISSSANGGGSIIARHIPLSFTPSPSGASNGLFTYFIDLDTQWLIGQGRYPFIQISSQSGSPMSGGGDCTLIGDLVTPVQ
jgi:hypothetical protein